MRFRRRVKYRWIYSAMSIPRSWKVQKQSVFGWYWTIESYNWHSFPGEYSWVAEDKAKNKVKERVKELQEIENQRER